MGLFDRWFSKDKPLRNDALEACIRDLAAEDTPSKRQSLYAILRQSTLILATPGAEVSPGNHVATEKTTIRFISTHDNEGRSVMLAFTSEAALLAWRPVGCSYTALAAKDIFGLVLQNDLDSILINPSGPVSGHVTRREIVALAEGLDPAASTHQLSDNTKIVVAPPTVSLSANWIAALRSTAEKSREVRGLFLVMATIGGGEPHHLVGVDLQPGADPDTIVPPLIQSIQGMIARGDYLDFVPMRTEDALSDQIRVEGVSLL